MESPRSLVAELLGTFWLVLGGCGTAVLAGSVMGTLGISIAFGLTVLTGVYFLGHISGGHFNPAVTVGLLVGRKFEPKNAIGYIVAQLIGAILAAVVILIVANGVDGFSASDSGPNFSTFEAFGALSFSVVTLEDHVAIVLGKTNLDRLQAFLSSNSAPPKEQPPFALMVVDGERLRTMLRFSRPSFRNWSRRVSVRCGSSGSLSRSMRW